MDAEAMLSGLLSGYRVGAGLSQIGTKEKAPKSNDSEAPVATLPCPHCKGLVAVYIQPDSSTSALRPTPEGPPDSL